METINHALIARDALNHKEVCTENNIIMNPVRTDNIMFCRIEVLHNNEQLEITEPLKIDCDETGFSPYIFMLCKLYKTYCEKLTKTNDKLI